MATERHAPNSRGQPRPQGHPDSLLNVWICSEHEIGVTAPGLAPAMRIGKKRELQGIGNPDILTRRCLGLICSVQCPGSVVIKTLDAIRELRGAGIVLAGGFHSPMERECLEFLLRGNQPIIVCPARTLFGFRIPNSWRTAIKQGRLLIASVFSERFRRTTLAHAGLRNEFVADLSTAIFVPHASRGGKAEALAARLVKRGQHVFTIEDTQNSHLSELGSRPYSVVEISQLLPAN
jgi:hypothetical protein